MGRVSDPPYLAEGQLCVSALFHDRQIYFSPVLVIRHDFVGSDGNPFFVGGS
jgi:hypothetical protein